MNMRISIYGSVFPGTISPIFDGFFFFHISLKLSHTPMHRLFSQPSSAPHSLSRSPPQETFCLFSTSSPPPPQPMWCVWALLFPDLRCLCCARFLFLQFGAAVKACVFSDNQRPRKASLFRDTQVISLSLDPFSAIPLCSIPPSPSTWR